MSSKDCSKLGLVILIVVLCHTFQQCGINAHPVEIKNEKNKKISKRAILCDVLDLILLAPVHSVGLLTTKRLRKLFCEDIPPRALPPHHHKDHHSTSEIPLTTQQSNSSVWTTVQPPKTSIQSSTSSPNLPVTETPFYQTTLSIPSNEGTYDSSTNLPSIPNLEPKINVPETPISTTPSSETIPFTTITVSSSTSKPKEIVEEDNRLTTLRPTEKSTDEEESNTIFTTPSFVTIPKTSKKDEISSTTTDMFQEVQTTSPEPEVDSHTTLSPAEVPTTKTVNQNESAYDTPHVTDEIPTTTALPVDHDSAKIYPTEKSTNPPESDVITTENSESNSEVTEKYDVPSTTIKVLEEVPVTTAVPETDLQTTLKSSDYPTTSKTINVDKGTYDTPEGTEKIPVTTISSADDKSSSNIQHTEKSTDAPETNEITTTENSEFYPKVTEKYETPSTSSNIIEKEPTTSVPDVDSPTTLKTLDEFTTPKTVDQNEGTHDTPDVTEESPVTTALPDDVTSSKLQPTQKSTDIPESDVVVTTESSELVPKATEKYDIPSTTIKILEEIPTTSPASEVDLHTTLSSLDQATTSKTANQDKGTYDTPDPTEEIPVTTASPVDDHSSSKMQSTENFTDEPVVTTESSELNPKGTEKYVISSTTPNILNNEPTTNIAGIDLQATLTPADYPTTSKTVDQDEGTPGLPDITEEIPITTALPAADDSSSNMQPTEKSTDAAESDGKIVTTESSKFYPTEKYETSSTTTNILEEELTTTVPEVDLQTTMQPSDQFTTLKTVDQDKGTYDTPEVTEKIPVTTISSADDKSSSNIQHTEKSTDAPETNEITTTENSESYPKVTEKHETSSTSSNIIEKEPTTSVPDVDSPTTLKTLDEFTTPKTVDQNEGTHDTPDVTEESPVTTALPDDVTSSKLQPTQKSTDIPESDVVVTTESSELVPKATEKYDIPSTTIKILEEIPTTSPASEVDLHTTLSSLDQATTSKTTNQDKGTYDTPDVTEEMPITTASPVDDDSSSKIFTTEKSTDKPESDVVVTTESSGLVPKATEKYDIPSTTIKILEEIPTTSPAFEVDLHTTLSPLDQATTSKTTNQDKGTYETPDVTEEMPITTASPVDDDSSTKIQPTENFTEKPLVTTESSELHSTATDKYDTSSTTANILEKEPTTDLPDVDLQTTMKPLDQFTTSKTVNQDDGTYDTPDVTEKIPATTVLPDDVSSSKLHTTEKSTNKPESDTAITTESVELVPKATEKYDIPSTTIKILEEAPTTSPSSEIDSQTTLRPTNSVSTSKIAIPDDSTEKYSSQPIGSSTTVPQTTTETEMAAGTEYIPTTIEPLQTETVKYPSTTPQTVTSKSTENTEKQEVEFTTTKMNDEVSSDGKIETSTTYEEHSPNSIPSEDVTVTVNPKHEPEATFTTKNPTASPETKVEFDSPTLAPQQSSNDTPTTIIVPITPSSISSQENPSAQTTVNLSPTSHEPELITTVSSTQFVPITEPSVTDQPASVTSDVPKKIVSQPSTEPSFEIGSETTFAPLLPAEYPKTTVKNDAESAIHFTTPESVVTEQSQTERVTSHSNSNAGYDTVSSTVESVENPTTQPDSVEHVTEKFSPTPSVPKSPEVNTKLEYEPVTMPPKSTVKHDDISSTSIRPATESQPTAKPEPEKVTTPESHSEVKTTIKQEYETIHPRPSAEKTPSTDPTKIVTQEASTESVKVSTESVTVSSTLAPKNSTEKTVTEAAKISDSSTSSPFIPTIESKINASDDPVSTKDPTTAQNSVSSTTSAPVVITSKSTTSPTQKSTGTPPKGKCIMVQGILVCPDDSIENYFSEK